MHNGGTVDGKAAYSCAANWSPKLLAGFAQVVFHRIHYRRTNQATAHMILCVSVVRTVDMWVSYSVVLLRLYCITLDLNSYLRRTYQMCFTVLLPLSFTGFLIYSSVDDVQRGGEAPSLGGRLRRGRRDADAPQRAGPALPLLQQVPVPSRIVDWAANKRFEIS